MATRRIPREPEKPKGQIPDAIKRGILEPINRHLATIRLHEAKIIELQERSLHSTNLDRVLEWDAEIERRRKGIESLKRVIEDMRKIVRRWE